VLKKLTRLVVVSLLTALGSGIAASAQSPKSPPSPPSQVVKLVPPHVGNGGSPKHGSAALPVGWYTFHIANCSVYFTATGPVLYIFPLEGGYWYTSNPDFKAVILPACQTGNYRTSSSYKHGISMA
jgi:hypothetical protein